MKKDYYEILGVAKSAAVGDIKKAYRSLALTHHPDRVPEEKKKEAEEKFKEISEAYAVLSDPQKRSMYDQHGHAGIDQQYTYEDIFKGADFSSIFEGLSGAGGIFEHLFGGDSADIFGQSSGRRQKRRGRDIQYEVEISFEEAFAGVKKTLKVPRHDLCDKCHGSGAKPGSTPKTCPHCHGKGQVVMSNGFLRIAQTCSQCHGQGKVITEFCFGCGGSGTVRVTRNIEVDFPAGVDNDTRLRVRGEGEAGLDGRGDLYVYVRLQKHAVFERRGNDVYLEQPVSFVKASLGAEVTVPTLKGNVRMKIPAGTQGGKVFRLKAEGFPDVHGRGQGDQYVQVMVAVPTRLTVDQKRILEEFAAVSGEAIDKREDSIKEKLKKVFK